MSEYVDECEIIKGVRVPYKIKRNGDGGRGKMKATSIALNHQQQRLYVLPGGHIRTKDGVLVYLNGLPENTLHALTVRI